MGSGWAHRSSMSGFTPGGGGLLITPINPGPSFRERYVPLATGSSIRIYTPIVLPRFREGYTVGQPRLTRVDSRLGNWLRTIILGVGAAAAGGDVEHPHAHPVHPPPISSPVDDPRVKRPGQKPPPRKKPKAE